MAKMQLEEKSLHGILKAQAQHGGVKQCEHVVGAVEPTRDTQKYRMVLRTSTCHMVLPKSKYRTVHKKKLKVLYFSMSMYRNLRRGFSDSANIVGM